MARDGFVVISGAVDEERLEQLTVIASGTPLTQEADYPGSDVDVGYDAGGAVRNASERSSAPTAA
jgi:hypothetical protein